MAAATTTIDGEIVLAGDLIGDANSPQLRASGVTPEAYPLTLRISVDKKGRTTSIGKMTQTEINSAIDAAYVLTPSAFTIIGDRPVLTIVSAPATSSSLGLVKATNGLVSVGQATNAVGGVVKIGSGVSILTNDSNMPTITNVGSFIIGDGTDYTSAGAMQFASGRYCQLTSTVPYSSSGTLKAYTSTTLTGTWTQSTGTMSSGYSESATGGASGNIGVIVGDGGNNYISTDSGQTWTTISGITVGNYPKVTWNGSVFCVVGYTYSGTYSLNAQTSSDGITWSVVNTIISGSASVPTFRLTVFGSLFAITVLFSPIQLWTGNGTTWTNRGTTPLIDGTIHYGLNNGKLLRHGPAGVLQTSSDSGVTWTYIYRSIANGGTDSNDYTKRLPYPYSISNEGYSITPVGFFATNGTTIGSKVTTLESNAFGANFSDATKIYFYLPTFNTNALNSVMYSVPKTDFAITGLSILRREGVGVDFTSLIPESGGTVTSGTVVPTSQQTITKSLVAASTAWSANSGGTNIATGSNSVVVNVSTYSCATIGANAAATSGSRVVQVFISPSGDWFTSYTDNGTIWVTSKINTPTGATPRLVGMEYLASASKFVMIGKQTSAVESQNWTAYSSDGISWTFNYSPWTSTAYITSNLSLGFSGVMATGRSGTTLCSVRTTNGTSWTLSTTALVPATTMSCTCMDTTIGNTAAMWTACNTTGPSAAAVYYSTNGTTWTVVSNAVSGTGGGMYAASSDGPCMILTSNGVLYTGRSTSAGAIAVNIIYLNNVGTVIGAGSNGYTLTMGSDSVTQPSMLFRDGSSFYVTRGSSVQRYGTSAAYGAGNATYPLLLGSTYVYPAFGSNMPGRAGGASTSLTDATTATILPQTTANKTSVNGPAQEIILRGAVEVAGMVYQITINAGTVVPILISASSADNCFIPSSAQISVPKSARVTFTALRTSDSKWLFFGD